MIFISIKIQTSQMTNQNLVSGVDLVFDPPNLFETTFNVR